MAEGNFAHVATWSESIDSSWRLVRRRWGGAGAAAGVLSWTHRLTRGWSRSEAASPRPAASPQQPAWKPHDARRHVLGDDVVHQLRVHPGGQEASLVPAAALVGLPPGGWPGRCAAPPWLYKEHGGMHPGMHPACPARAARSHTRRPRRLSRLRPSKARARRAPRPLKENSALLHSGASRWRQRLSPWRASQNLQHDNQTPVTPSFCYPQETGSVQSRRALAVRCCTGVANYYAMAGQGC